MRATLRTPWHSACAQAFGTFLLTILVATVLPSLASGTPLQQDTATENPETDLQSRLAALENELEQSRKDMNIPGIAIAVVKDGKVIMAKGFGFADVKNEKPVTQETIFAIGSSTKAFTATAIGMLQDEGKLTFDSPVQQFLPNFKLDIETDGNEITLRDLLCHRTGFTRMGVLWAAGKLTADEVMMYAGRAKPTEKFRDKFQYNNVMYMIAGNAAAAAGETTWPNLIADKIFQPLGMTNSSTSIMEAQKDDRLALGYRWNAEREKFQLLPMRNLDLIGPAGSINSNVNDMGKWVAFQLAKGQADDSQIIKSETVEQTWEQQIEIAGEVGYGLGWMRQKWNGKTVIEHGGNIDGFGAQVTLLPEENLGYVLLTNVTATPLQAGSIKIVFDTLLGESTPNSTTEEKPTVDSMEAFIGKYEATMGGIKGKHLTVSIEDEKLFLDVPGQMNFELNPPDDQGKWQFKLTDTIAISFVTEAGSNKATSLMLHQGGLDMECVRQGYERIPPVPLSELKGLLGKYRNPDDDKELQVVIHKNILAIDVPQMGLVELDRSDEDGKWKMRANDAMIQIKFELDDNGNATSFTRFQSGKETAMLRVDSDEEPSERKELPEAMDLIKNVREKLLPQGPTSFRNVQMTGEVHLVNQGARGSVEYLMSGFDAFAATNDFGSLGITREFCDGENGWSDSSFSPFEELEGKHLMALRMRHPLWLCGDWESAFKDPKVLREDKANGHPSFVVRFRGIEVPDRTIYIDKTSNLILKEEWSVLMPGIGELPITTSYDQWLKSGPLLLPFKITSRMQQTGSTVMRFNSAVSRAQKPDFSHQK